MTDRHAGYIVTLADDVREDDAQAIIAALGMVKGVLSVEPITADPRTFIAEARRDVEWASRIHDVVRAMSR
jgi:hypothetical protein